MIIYNPTKEDIARAAKILQDVGIVFKMDNANDNNECNYCYPDVFDGYVSSFGASIAQCGMNVTLRVFENTDSDAKMRKWLPEIIRLYLNEKKGKDKIASDKPLSRILQTTELSKRDNLAKDIEAASVAFKVALRMFKGSKCNAAIGTDYLKALNHIEEAEKVIRKSEIEAIKSQEEERKKKNLPKPKPDTCNMGHEFQFNNIDITSWNNLGAAIKINEDTIKTLKDKGGYSCFTLKVLTPGLLIGSGLSHGITGEDDDFKTGMQFDYTTGLPIIPGSSVKGVLKSYFKDFAPKDVHAEALLKQIFEEGNNKDIFADALITKAGKNGRVVGEDYITPHYPNLLKDPKPIKILKVLPGVEFTFCLKLSGSIGMDASKKEACFKEILQMVGIGAKTNVGYGRLKEVKSKAD